MNYSIISTRYAKALFKAGTENQCIDPLKADMELLAATVKDNPVFVQVLDDPVIKPPQKRTVVSELIGKYVHPMTINFVNILIRNRREMMLCDVARRFIDLYEESKNIKRAHIISAVGMDNQSKQQLQEQLNKLFDAEVQMTAEVNPELIGGFVFRVGDRQYNASISASLERIKERLMQS